jgi:hypothetical protein
MDTVSLRIVCLSVRKHIHMISSACKGRPFIDSELYFVIQNADIHAANGYIAKVIMIAERGNNVSV